MIEVTALSDTGGRDKDEEMGGAGGVVLDVYSWVWVMAGSNLSSVRSPVEGMALETRLVWGDQAGLGRPGVREPALMRARVGLQEDVSRLEQW